MSTYVQTEDGRTWINAEMIEAVQLADTSAAGLHVDIITANGTRYTYTTLVLDEAYGLELVAEVVGRIMGHEQERVPGG